MRWSLVVPVKRLAEAKTRLSPMSDAARADLALAFALDTVAAARAAERVVDVVAVSDDPRAVTALAAAGVHVVPDTPDAGLNPALLHGAAEAAQRSPGAGVGALSSDLPSLRPVELDRALAAAEVACSRSPVGSAMVADAGGLGTTLLVARDLASFDPRFGPRSRAWHRSAGVVEVAVDGIPSVRRDVDTAVDLHDARRLGLGERTAAVVATLT